MGKFEEEEGVGSGVESVRAQPLFVSICGVLLLWLVADAINLWRQPSELSFPL